MKRIHQLFLALFLIGAGTAFAYHPITSSPMPSHAGTMAEPYPVYPRINYGQGVEGDIVKRGEYLVRLGECIACHTKQGEKPFAGGYSIKTQFGTLKTPNITPDKVNGIGEWHFDDFKKAMRDGKKPHGGSYNPAFPYPYFTRVTDQDLQAIWAYLQQVPASDRQNEKHDLHFPYNLPMSQDIWRAMHFKQTGPMVYDNNESAAWNRGAYLVEGLGHCSMCHSPTNAFSSSKQAKHLSGGYVGGFWAPDINARGFENRSIADMVQTLAVNHDNQNETSQPSPTGAIYHNSMSYLEKNDLKAVATYLKQVGEGQGMPQECSKSKLSTLSRGHKVYQKACALCHQTGQLGAPMITDNANWEIRAKKGLPVLSRNVMYGYNNMPVKGNCVDCSDKDIKAAVKYILHKSLGAKVSHEMLSIAKNREVTIGDGKHLYEQVCAQCHDKGILNAPVLGDKKAWEPIIKKDLDVLVKTAVMGNHKKPYMSGCKTCTTKDIKAAVKYMVQESKTKGDYNLW